MLLLVLVLPCLALGENFPDKMLGTYQLETSQGFSDFMYQIGVNWFTRQIACTLYPKVTYKNLGENMVAVDTSSTFKSKSQTLQFGVPLEATTDDGRKVRTVVTLNGNTLTAKQNGLEGAVSTMQEVTFTEDGKKMTVVNTVIGNTDVRSVRVFKKI